MNKNLEDKKLIDEIIHGKKSSFEKLIIKYQHYVYSITFNILKIKEDSEEAVQDVFLKAFKNISTFNHQSKFSTWLFRIAYNTALTKLKKQKKHISLDEKLDIIEHNQIDEFEVLDQKKYLRQAMNKLSETDNAILTFFYLKELSLNEISEIMDINISTLKVRLFRARKKIMKEMIMLLKNEAKIL